MRSTVTYPVKRMYAPSNPAIWARTRLAPLEGAGPAGPGTESVLPGGDFTPGYSVALVVGRRRAIRQVSGRDIVSPPWSQPPAAATPSAALRAAMMAPPTVIARNDRAKLVWKNLCRSQARMSSSVATTAIAAPIAAP